MSKQPHICFVALKAYPMVSGEYQNHIVGGAELQQILLAKELASRGYSVSMICMDFGQSGIVEIDGIKIHKCFGPKDGIPVIRFFFPRMTSIWRCLKRIKADILYTRTASMLPGLIAGFALIYQKKTIFCAADDRDFSGKQARIRFLRDRLIFQWGLKRVDKVVVQNEKQKVLCQKNYGIQAEVIENIAIEPTSTVGQHGDSILWISTIRQVKRPDLLIELAQILSNHHFVMIGGAADEETRLYNEIEAKARSVDNVDFVGFLPPHEVDEYFDKAKILLNTSDTEGFPNTFLQAWSRSIPTVSFIDCGARLEKQNVGICVDDLPHMAKMIDTLYKDKVRYSIVAKRSREYCTKVHSSECVVAKFEKVITNLVFN